ncbi:uncharacterized protein LOC132548214 [Ylistrum balloti]|uniref:uncharacterized protein LOC132548214 n=1 Tax=Ylistrum balloti TaxID=509963 RepID=UPI002905CFF1|nr:uncharacterized protein LOC132548214 [Ylistrum balloti]XP_060068019.1 uncharacterized protein LOC132548214 [Ylistrum balloti]
MKIHTIRQTYSVTVIFFIVASVYTEATFTRSLCEGRCESSTPHLQTLKDMWHKMSKRIGKQDMSFEAFVTSLVAASERYTWLKPVRGDLLGMIAKYQDCVKACEHQHSKRTSERASDSYVRPALCLTKDFCL